MSAPMTPREALEQLADYARKYLDDRGECDREVAVLLRTIEQHEAALAKTSEHHVLRIRHWEMTSDYRGYREAHLELHALLTRGNP